MSEVVDRWLRARQERQARVTQARDALAALTVDERQDLLAEIVLNEGRSTSPHVRLHRRERRDGNMTLEQAIVSVLSDGQPRITANIRHAVVALMPNARTPSINAMISAMLKSGLLRRIGGNGRSGICELVSKESGAGTCQVTDGPIAFTIAQEGDLWRVTAPSWGTGTASRFEDPSGDCSTAVELVNSDGVGLWTYRFHLAEANEAIVGVLGQLEAAPGDGSTCTHNFELADVRWTP